MVEEPRILHRKAIARDTLARIVNTLTRQEDMLEVCSEESMQQILDSTLILTATLRVTHGKC